MTYYLLYFTGPFMWAEVTVSRGVKATAYTLTPEAEKSLTVGDDFLRSVR